MNLVNKVNKSMGSSNTDKKEAILEAALSLIAKKGFHASPMSQISKRANVSVGTIYKHFKSKDHLINELFKYVDMNLNKIIIKDLDTNAPVKEQFTNLSKELLQIDIHNLALLNFHLQYIDSPYGLVNRSKLYQSKRYPPKHTIIRTFYDLFDTAKEQNIIKNLPNFILFTITFGSLSHFRGARLGFG